MRWLINFIGCRAVDLWALTGMRWQPLLNFAMRCRVYAEMRL